ncbi:putative beta-1,4-mannosyltransferase [Tothia fuscella]|uniref:Chitobiosyldiphosphodolichol beta-mannosyltransferase n=1 Tax=Tothia fuscella TaxID=1048955 RepID=A0A9P4U4M4_9PEZI|nr:putative beta-1,4-mannosyltransferase [Tothia fuscella]
MIPDVFVFESPLDYLLPLAVTISTLITVLLITSPSRYDSRIDSTPPRRQSEDRLAAALKTEDVPTESSKGVVSVQIVVLGDIGRSPRMQYHALSIAKHGGRVDIIGYQESDILPEILETPLINIIPISPAPKVFQTSNNLLFLLVAPLKVLWQICSLYYVLGYCTKPAKWMLVQNPPSIPTLAISRIICCLRATNLVIDWHNFGYSILALKMGESHRLVKFAKALEVYWSRSATAHLTVTNAMARVLKNDFDIQALPLHDRPPNHFQPLSSKQKSSFLAKLPETAKYASELQSGSRKLIVSATSWTPDEDFSLLLDAIVTYSTQASSNPKLPKILAIITGKGPQKQHYLSKIAHLNKTNQLSHVDITTAWLTMQDYASLLGAADLGISLHTSSSGVDLPMKVVDMFGTGLPVLGWSKFEAWSELVTEGVNGKGFGSAEVLSELLVEVLADEKKLAGLREGALRECDRRWDDEWDPVAGRLLGLVD